MWEVVCVWTWCPNVSVWLYSGRSGKWSLRRCPLGRSLNGEGLNHAEIWGRIATLRGKGMCKGCGSCLACLESNRETHVNGIGWSEGESYPQTFPIFWQLNKSLKDARKQDGEWHDLSSFQKDCMPWPQCGEMMVGWPRWKQGAQLCGYCGWPTVKVLWRRWDIYDLGT